MTSQYFYNFTTNVSLSLWHLQRLAGVEVKARSGLWMISSPPTPPQVEGGEGEGRGNEDQLKTRGPAGLTLQGMDCGMQGCGF